jgi:hypothetical protein
MLPTEFPQVDDLLIVDFANDDPGELHFDRHRENPLQK